MEKPFVLGTNVIGAGELDGARDTALVEDLDDVSSTRRSVPLFWMTTDLSLKRTPVRDEK